MRMRKGMSEKEASDIASRIARENKKVRVQNYNIKPNLCINCKLKIPYEKRSNKFCSHSCSASHNNLGIKRFIGKGIIKDKVCEKCGKITKNKRFCSNKCFGLYRKDLSLKFVVNADCIKNKYEKWIIEEIRGKKCECCKNSEWMGKLISLNLHHIDGDTDNNKFNNLVLLCPNCHSNTDNYGSKNIDLKNVTKKKKYRNNRYKNGLSY